jgi:hypothetical protein
LPFGSGGQARRHIRKGTIEKRSHPVLDTAALAAIRLSGKVRKMSINPEVE